MSDSNWGAPTPGTAAEAAKPHWSKRKAGPLPVWGWIAGGMVLLGIIGSLTDESAEDEPSTATPLTVESEADLVKTDTDDVTPEMTAADSDASDDDDTSILDELSEDMEALEGFYDDLKDRVSETADRVVTAIDTSRNNDIAAADNDADESAAEERDAAPATTAPPVETTAAPAATPAESVSQREARESAASYLRYSSFSRLGLIDQLEFEGFTTEDATYGVDVQNADWFAQAVLTAESYLEYSSFSRSELIGQLEYEEFTSEQAAHAVDVVYTDSNSGTGETIGQANARKSAASYLQYSSFSRSGLIDQLEYEGFTTEDATYGVDMQNADWFAQAAATAERYLEYSSFSRSELIGQLEFEGFTSDQAAHGVNAVGL